MKLCGFSASSVYRSEKSQSISLGIVFSLFVFATIVVAISAQKWRYLPVPEKITSPQHITLNDKIQILTLLVSCVQLCALAITADFVFQDSFNFVQTFKSIFSFFLADIVSLTFSVYWSIVWICVVLSILFCIYICVLFLHWVDHLPNSFVSVLSLFGPIVGTIAFIPLLSVLLSVFSCAESSSQGPFLARDCTTLCWEGRHVVITIVSALSILLYLPLALWARPVWQQIREDAIVKSTPIYIVLSTATKFVLVVTYTFLSYYPLSATLLFFTCTTLMVIYSVKYHPYNVEKVNLYCVTSWALPAISGFISLLDVALFHDEQQDTRSTVIWKTSVLKTNVEFEHEESNFNSSGSQGLVFALLLLWMLVAIVMIVVDHKKHPHVFIRSANSRKRSKQIAQALRTRNKRLSKSKAEVMASPKIYPGEQTGLVLDSKSNWDGISTQVHKISNLVQAIKDSEEKEEAISSLLSESFHFFESLQTIYESNIKSTQQARLDSHNPNQQDNFAKETKQSDGTVVESKSIHNSQACENGECQFHRFHSMWHGVMNLRDQKGNQPIQDKMDQERQPEK